MVAAHDARHFSDLRAGDHARSSVRPLFAAFQLPLAGMVMRGSGPNLKNELDGSQQPAGFPDPDLFDHSAHSGRRRLAPSDRHHVAGRFPRIMQPPAPGSGSLPAW